MKMTEYAIETVRGHILINDDRGSRVLVDTGSPLSFHAGGVIALGGSSFTVPASLMGTDSAYVTDNVGVRVDGLVGMDILSQGGLLIDVPGGRIVLGHPTDGMTPLPSRQAFGYVSMEMLLVGRPARVLLDTGAPTSYVSPSFTEGLTPIDRVTDFNPMVPGDTFETPVFELPASFAGQDFAMRAGHLPSRLQMMVSMLGADAVVGLEILRRFPVAVAEGKVWV